MGRIEREVARMARSFDVEVHCRDQTRLPSTLEQGAIFHEDDDSFLAASDARVYFSIT
jgi:lactate dehydrogenase-like 2-hydroxyacid dehydrogenase